MFHVSWFYKEESIINANFVKEGFFNTNSNAFLLKGLWPFDYDCSNMFFQTSNSKGKLKRLRHHDTSNTENPCFKR